MKRDSRETEAARRLSRRSLLRVGGTAATAAFAAPGVAGAASAQITTDAALPADAPTMDKDDYTGLFLRVGDRNSEADTSGLSSCDFLDDGAAAVAYDAELVDRIGNDTRSADTALYAAEANENVSPDDTFVINTQSSCSGDFVSVNLEGVQGIGRAGVGTGEPVTPHVAVNETTATDTTTPGFGVLTAVAGVGAAALAALKRAA
ncbi:MAG: PGF-CTERM sorting domain-containing protein [Salinigranum sp.]